LVVGVVYFGKVLRLHVSDKVPVLDVVIGIDEHPILVASLLILVLAVIHPGSIPYTVGSPFGNVGFLSFSVFIRLRFRDFVLLEHSCSFIDVLDFKLRHFG